jgi:nitrate reductase delta subunit
MYVLTAAEAIAWRTGARLVSDYQSALAAWLKGQNPDRAPMPESFRIASAWKKSPEHYAALDRVKGWTRERFGLPEDSAIMVAEISCSVPGCPPLETAIAFWTEGDRRHQFKVFKPVAEVVEDDLPPAWLKDALVAGEDDGFDCC